MDPRYWQTDVDHIGAAAHFESHAAVVEEPGPGQIVICRAAADSYLPFLVAASVPHLVSAVAVAV